MIFNLRANGTIPFVALGKVNANTLEAAISKFRLKLAADFESGALNLDSIAGDVIEVVHVGVQK